MISLHERFGKHEPDFSESHWERGLFVTRCIVCGRQMVKLPGLPWRIREKRG